MAEATAKRKAERREPIRRLTATELARRLSDVLNRVYYQRETILVERGGKPVCQLTPPPASLGFRLSDLVTLLESMPAAGEEWAEAVTRGVADQDEFEGLEWPR